MAHAHSHEKIPFVTSTVEESPIVRRLEVEVDASEVGKAFERGYRALARQARVRGFRPGKAPRSVLEKLYGASLAEEIEHNLVAGTLEDAIRDSGLEPVAEPRVESDAPTPGEGFRYAVRIELKPEISLPDLDGLPARKPAVNVGDDEVDEELEDLRQRNAPLVEEPEETPAAEGHTLSIDFVGRIDGQPFEGGSGQGMNVEIGAGGFLPGFEEQLVGARAGEDRELRVRFPDDYGKAELAGKEAVFAVHVVDVKRRQVPELDDEFAKDMGDFDSLAALRERVLGDLTASREATAKRELRRTLMDALIERAPFDVPAGLVERQLESQLAAARGRLGGAGLPEETLRSQVERWREDWRPAAEREVREMLLLEAVARQQEIEVDDAAVELKLSEMAGEQGVDPQRLEQAYGGDALRRMLRAQLVDDRALDFLVGKAKVEETTDT